VPGDGTFISVDLSLTCAGLEPFAVRTRANECVGHCHLPGIAQIRNQWKRLVLVVVVVLLLMLVVVLLLPLLLVLLVARAACLRWVSSHGPRARAGWRCMFYLLNSSPFRPGEEAWATASRGRGGRAWGHTACHLRFTEGQNRARPSLGGADVSLGGPPLKTKRNGASSLKSVHAAQLRIAGIQTRGLRTL
jgi:hypothetical protein